MTSELAWSDVERITRGRPGRKVLSTCPLCSEHRSPANRRARCFAVTLREADFAIFNCLNCGAHGHVRPDKATVIDFAERQRLRDEARRRDAEDARKRTGRALELWGSRQPF